MNNRKQEMLVLGSDFQELCENILAANEDVAEFLRYISGKGYDVTFGSVTISRPTLRKRQDSYMTRRGQVRLSRGDKRELNDMQQGIWRK